MELNQILKWIENNITADFPYPQKEVLQGILQGHTYEEIANPTPYSCKYIKNKGIELLRNIEQKLGIPVNKKTLRTVLEQKIKAEITGEAPTSESVYDIPMITSNPFNDIGCIQNPDRFFDREQILNELLNGLSQGYNYSLIGDTKIGKSSILWRICHHIGSQELKMEPDNFIYLDMQCIHNTNDFFTALCSELNFDQTYRGFELKRRLRGQRYILCVDEIEKMTNTNNFSGDEQTELRGLSDGTNAPFSLVIASRTPLYQLFPDSPERTSPLYNICSPIRLKGFSHDIAIKFINHRLQGTDITFTEDQINELINKSQGNPFSLQNHAANLYNERNQ
jgi:hypothetical protein